jgi:two-component system LytT family response regulator
MKTLIIEDEAAAVRRLSKLILEIDSSIEIVDDLDSIENSLDWLHSNPIPDLIFMDIHLADGASFEIFNHFEISKPIIFTTAYNEYAIQAFKVNTIDYLLKPIKKPELEAAINKYRKLARSQTFDYKTLAREMNRDEYNKRFLIRFGQQIRVVEMRDCAYFYTQNKVTFLVTKKGKRYPIDYSLEKIEEMTDPHGFFRINRQFIINIEAINEMYAYSKSRVKIDLNPSCELDTIVSTERSPHFKKWLVGEE